MSDQPGRAPLGGDLPLEIEAVEWAPTGGDTLLVRVSGQWRRRRTGARSRPVLVVSGPQRRHRFPALPEPPDRAGARGRAAWRAAFSVPAELADHLELELVLQFGNATIPLPPAVRITRGGDGEPEE